MLGVNVPKPIGAILIENHGIKSVAIDATLSTQNETDLRLGELLVKAKLIGEVDLLEALGKQFEIEVVPGLPSEIKTEFTEILSISFLKKNKLVPIHTNDEKFIALNDPTQYQACDEIQRSLGWVGCRLVLCSHQTIVSAINYAYDMTQDSAEEVLQDIDEDDPEKLFSEIEEIGDLLDDTSGSPVIRLVNLMFSQAIRDGASDIHIEPYQNTLKVRQRIDGILYNMLSPPKHVQSSLISRIKIMAKLDIAEKRMPQDGRIELKVGDKEIDVRVSTLPTYFGERVVMRLLDKSSILISLKDLGMPEDRFKPFNEMITSANGIILVTGPTGSGKTTTLYAALSSINNTDINIITVEDPIEYQISGIGQVQINPKIGLTFASGLRSIVRQDPDVILVGEIRDSETAEIAVQSALTGHLVFSTLHTNDSASAITRLHDMGIEPFLIASSINAVLAQRLIRVICEHCKEAYDPEPEELHRLGIYPEAGAVPKVFRGRGCVKCNQTGYRGRRGIFELLTMTKEIKSLVLSTSDANVIKKRGVEQGMVSLQSDGASKVLQGITTIEEVHRVCQE